jgi:serine acetyltransferase
VLPGARIGSACSIGGHTVIGEGAALGDRVTLRSGVKVAADVRLEDDVTVGADAVFSEDGPARDEANASPTLVRAGASIGANATILAGVTIGSSARVAAGAVVTRSVPPNSIVMGNPGQIVGYVDTADRRAADYAPGGPRIRATSLPGVALHYMRNVEDLRGNLSVGELGRDVPFEVKRYFLVYDVPSMELRGEHAHLQCHQFLIAVKGSLHVVADDGRQREEIVLDRPSLGLHLAPMIWGIQYRYSADAVLLVLASDHYDAADYIRDYDQFLMLASQRAKT